MREDMRQTHHVTTTPSGPEWSSVVRRKVVDIDSEELLEDISVDPDLHEDEYRYDLGNIQRNIRTELTYRERPDVSEVYSPPRITAEAAKMGMKPGFSLDLTVTRSDGEAWDFTRKRHRDEATRMVVESEPFGLIGTPACTIFSILQNGNRHRYSQREWKEK